MVTFDVADAEKLKATADGAKREVTRALRQRFPVGKVIEGWNQKAPLAFGTSAEQIQIDSPTNGFVGAALRAFMCHFSLILKPDDLWLVLAQGFAKHVEKNPGRHENLFAKGGKKPTLTVELDRSLWKNPNGDWTSALADFGNQIAGHVGKTADLLVSDFSTTGAVERAASQVVLMGAFKEAFDYMGHTACGIPSITLLGTPEDWKSIRTRAKVFTEFESMHDWFKVMDPFLAEFEAASGGSADRKLWQSFVKINDQSGGPYVTGWINAFFPFLTSRRYDRTGTKVSVESAPNRYMAGWERGMREGFGGGPSPDQYPCGYTVVPWKWNYFDSIHPMQFLGGFFGESMNDQEQTVRPVLGWAVMEDS